MANSTDDLILNQNCPCGQQRSLRHCCGAFIFTPATAPTAETLMRSRYTAFCLREADFLLATWHPSTRPKTLEFDPAQHWLGLKIIACQGGKGSDSHGQVEFLARYKIQGRAYRLQETSRFLHLAEGWVYLDGDIRDNA